MKPIGVLALQGNFASHIQRCQSLGHVAVEVRNVAELDGIRALIIPGGESSSLLRLMQTQQWLTAIAQFYHAGGAILGTCAGLILLAKQVQPQQSCLGLLDVVVQRNAYGRQRDSFVADGEVSSAVAAAGKVPMVFIRAPKIISFAESVKPLGYCHGEPTIVASECLLACSFHPEMSCDVSIHRYFIESMVIA